MFLTLLADSSGYVLYTFALSQDMIGLKSVLRLKSAISLAFKEKISNVLSISDYDLTFGLEHLLLGFEYLSHLACLVLFVLLVLPCFVLLHSMLKAIYLTQQIYQFCDICYC